MPEKSLNFSALNCAIIKRQSLYGLKEMCALITQMCMTIQLCLINSITMHQKLAIKKCTNSTNEIIGT